MSTTRALPSRHPNLVLLLAFVILPGITFLALYAAGLLPGVVALSCVLLIWLILALVPLPRSPLNLPERLRDAEAASALTGFSDDPVVERFLKRVASLSSAEWRKLFDAVEPATLRSFIWRQRSDRGAQAQLRRRLQSLPLPARAYSAGIDLIEQLFGRNAIDRVVALQLVALSVGNAAAAISLRGVLSPSDFQRIYEPFARVVPISDLLAST